MNSVRPTERRPPVAQRALLCTLRRACTASDDRAFGATARCPYPARQRTTVPRPARRICHRADMDMRIEVEHDETDGTNTTSARQAGRFGGRVGWRRSDVVRGRQEHGTE